MNRQFAKNFINPLAKLAGISINGQEPWNIQIHNDEFYTRVLKDGALGLGESYMEKWWDCPRLDILFTKLMMSHLDEKVKNPLRIYLRHLLSKLIDFQSKSHAKEVAYKHYDIGCSWGGLTRLKNKYDDRFFRMWNYYLLSSAGGFRARSLQLWQIALSPNGVVDGYESIR